MTKGSSRDATSSHLNGYQCILSDLIYRLQLTDLFELESDHGRAGTSSFMLDTGTLRRSTTPSYSRSKNERNPVAHCGNIQPLDLSKKVGYAVLLLRTNLRPSYLRLIRLCYHTAAVLSGASDFVTPGSRLCRVRWLHTPMVTPDCQCRSSQSAWALNTGVWGTLRWNSFIV